MLEIDPQFQNLNSDKSLWNIYQNIFQNQFLYQIFHMIAAPKRKQRNISSFLKKTYQILQNSQNHKIVKWAPDGKGFIVVSEQAFSKQILPKYFKHSNYSSFVRQLNMYSFHKMRQSGTESFFFHEFFNQNDIESIYQIKRKPERKKRKGEDENLDSEEQIQIPKSIKLTSKRTRQVLKEKSNDLFTKASQEIPSQNQVICWPQQNNSKDNFFNIDDDEDNISIAQGIDEKLMERPMLNTKQLISPSNTNFYPILQHSPSIYSIGSLIR